MIIPLEELNVMTGLLDAVKTFFETIQLSILVIPVLFIIFLGNMGSATAWMLGSTRGMFVACQHNHVGRLLQKVNRYEAPIGVLMIEACIFTIACGIFLLFPTVTDPFWVLLDLASEITLIYYLILFYSSIRLLSFKFSAVLGIITCLFAFILVLFHLLIYPQMINFFFKQL